MFPNVPDASPEPGIHRTARERRRIAIRALSHHLDSSDASSSASRLGTILSGPPRPIVISGDIDGVVASSMLASVAPGWEVVAIVLQSQAVLLHPSLGGALPDDVFGIDLFSLRFDNVSNHVVKYGIKRLQVPAVKQAFDEWDAAVETAANTRLLAVPALWAGTQACYEDAFHATSAKYKYPLGTAQILLALLEVAGHPPRFYDRQYLPWLVANCDGGISSYFGHAYNAVIWWPTMAAAVGPASLTEQIYQLVATMRPHDFIDAVNRLDRERQASETPRWLNDDWNLVDQSVETLVRTFTWLNDLSGWRDPVRGGTGSLPRWHRVTFAAGDMGQVYLGGPGAAQTKTNPIVAADTVRGALTAVNANFYFGGFSGSRFNWAGRLSPQPTAASP